MKVIDVQREEDEAYRLGEGFIIKRAITFTDADFIKRSALSPDYSVTFTPIKWAAITMPGHE